MIKRAVKDLEVYYLQGEESRPPFQNKCCILFASQGTSLFNGKEIKPGSGYFSIDDDFSLKMKKDSEIFLILFDKETHKEFLPYLEEKDLSYLPEKSQYSPLMKKILLQEDISSENFYHLMNLEIRINLLESRRRYQMKNHADFSIQQVLDYIHAHIKDKMSLTSLAKTFYYHPAYLSYKFKEQTKENIIDYIKKEKCKGVLSLYQEGITLERASQEYGFDNYPTFYRTYKAIYHQNPKEAKKV